MAVQRSKALAGRLGGQARALNLGARQRRSAARRAASARWQSRRAPFPASPATAAEIASFVAHFRSAASTGFGVVNLPQALVQAVSLARRDPFVARMLPTLLWRARDLVDQGVLVAAAERKGLGRPLGYFLDLASQVSGDRVCPAALKKLRSSVRAGRLRPVFLHEHLSASPWRAMLAEQQTPALGRKWGLITGTSVESAQSYFDKVKAL